MPEPLSASSLNRAAQILARLPPQGAVADVLRRELTPRRDLPPAERRAVAAAIAAWFRWQRWLDPATPRARQLGEAVRLQARFDRAPGEFKAETLAARAVPGWLADAMDALPPPWLRQLQREPALWIRARQADAAALPAALGDCVPAPGPLAPGGGPPTALRYRGTRDLFLTPQFHEGRFEIQDLASQLVGHACAPRPGETWWDACAGEGGKTLHLADLMHNRGLIWATDRSARRLQVLKKRAARAGVFNYRTAAWNGGPRPPVKTRFDGVLVDAPCSGIGTWQRHPQARWTTTPADVEELAAVQRRLLDAAAGSLKPGGRLIYAVCTLTRAETAGMAAEFTSRHPEFVPAAVFPEAGDRKPATGNSESSRPDPPSPAAGLRSLSSVLLWPHELDASGMFIAAWTKAA